MNIKPTELRRNLFHILDEVADEGKVFEIQRNGRTILIMPEKMPSRLARLKKQSLVIGDPEDFVHIDWSEEWDEEKNL